MTASAKPTEYDAQLGARVAEAREAAGLRQADLGKRLGLTRSSIANIEAGRQRVMCPTLMACGDALGVDPRWLLAGPYAPGGTPLARGTSRADLDRIRRGVSSLRTVADALDSFVEAKS